MPNLDISLENVYFAYDEKEVLKGINLTIPQGKITAFVGPSGSGKSTIAKLIASFWDVTGGLITIGVIDKEAAEEINKIFFEVIIAPDYDVDALEILGQKKNRIILVRKEAKLPKKQFRALLNGVLVQDKDTNIETVADLKTVTDKAPTPEEVEDMLFANKIVKNSKSNAIVLAKDKQLLASGVGQTSRVDALKQAIEKAKSFGFDLNGAVMASDAFFPFPDCVEIADKEGITAVIQPGGSVKDDLSFAYCNEHGMAMVTTGIRHFKH